MALQGLDSAVSLLFLLRLAMLVALPGDQGQASAVKNNNNGDNNTPAYSPWYHHLQNNTIVIGYLTGSLMRSNTDGKFYERPGARISGALTYALDQVNSDPEVLPNHTLAFLLAETYGEESESIKQTILLLTEGIAAYIGPQETCSHEGRIAAAFNMPMISYVSKAFSLSFLFCNSRFFVVCSSS